MSEAAGEALVCHKLAVLGWYALNANHSGARNVPNLDIVALKGRRRITLQVRAAVATGRWVMFAGMAKAEGNYFNAKRGPKADYVAFIKLSHHPEVTPVSYIMTANRANNLAKLHVIDTLKKKKRDGTRRKANFPVWIQEKKLTRWREAWGQL